MLDQRRGEDHAELPHSFIIGCVRMLHRFRLVGGLAFCAVLLITGPILAIDPPEFTWPAVAMCAAIWVTAALALLLARQERAPAAIHYLTISTDVALVSGIALMLGGSTSIMPIMYFIVIGATGLLLQRWPLLFAVLASIGALVGMDVMSDPRLTADDLIVWVVTLLVFGLATAGVISSGRRLAHQAVDRERERNEIRRTFGQHVSPQVVDALLNQRAKESASQDATVMFLDIRGFTTLSESRKPPEVVALLNQLFGFMIERINEHDGIINKFLGDGFMAAFGAPMSTGQDTRVVSRQVVYESVGFPRSPRLRSSRTATSARCR